MPLQVIIDNGSVVVTPAPVPTPTPTPTPSPTPSPSPTPPTTPGTDGGGQGAPPTYPGPHLDPTTTPDLPPEEGPVPHNPEPPTPPTPTPSPGPTGTTEGVEDLPFTVFGNDENDSSSELNDQLKKPQGIGQLWSAMWTTIWTRPPDVHTTIQGLNDGTQDLFKQTPNIN